MTFIHPLMLAGLAVVGVPVLIHLIMRQQPRHLRFPAFRFLKQKALTNRRKLRLRHLLLLALRMLILAALALALARPRVLSENLHLAGDTPVAAVLVVDTSASMGYAAGGVTRLDEARRRAVELLDGFPEGSRVAVLPTHEPAEGWSPSPSAARDRLSALEVVPANRPVTDALADAYRLFASGDGEDAGKEALPRLVYLLTDRTPAAWDAGRQADLVRLRDAVPAPAPVALVVDVGEDKPIDLAVADVELPAQAVPANRPAVLRVAVQAAAPDADREFDTELLVRFDNEATPERRAVKVRPGQAQVVEVSRPNLAPGFHQAEVTLATPDALAADNERFATVEVLGPRQVLVIADEPKAARVFRAACETLGRFRCEVRTPAEARDLSAEELSAYRVVVLLSVARPAAEGLNDLWGRLGKYVARGGHLAVAPGDEAAADDYATPAARALLPGRLAAAEQVPGEAGLPWQWRKANFQHPFLAPFREWSQQPDTEDYVGDPRGAFRWWRVEADGPGNVIVSYPDPEAFARDPKTLSLGPPALLEKASRRAAGSGRVLLFTTPLDDRRDARGRPANDYLGLSSFYLVLVNKALGYLAGDDEPATYNHAVGQSLVLPLPAAPRFPSYTLEGPGLTAADSLVQPAAGGAEVRLTPEKTARPGNFALTGGERQWQARFSCNVPGGEWQLAKVPAEALEAVLGPGAVLPAGANKPVRELIEGRFARPLDLFPLLMVGLLLLLAVENFVANRFYRRPETSAAGEPDAPGPMS